MFFAETSCRFPFLFRTVRTYDDPLPKVVFCYDQARHDGQIVRVALGLSVEVVLADDGIRVLFISAGCGIPKAGWSSDRPFGWVSHYLFNPERLAGSAAGPVELDKARPYGGLSHAGHAGQIDAVPPDLRQQGGEVACGLAECVRIVCPLDVVVVGVSRRVSPPKARRARGEPNRQTAHAGSWPPLVFVRAWIPTTAMTQPSSRRWPAADGGRWISAHAATRPTTRPKLRHPVCRSRPARGDAPRN